MKLRFYAIIGTMFILAGALLFSGSILEHFMTHNATPAKVPHNSLAASKQTASVTPAPASTPSSTTPAVLSGTPASISIPSVHISLPVGLGYYNAQTQKWTLGNSEAYFATPSTPANNQSGNTFIYGHNRASVFNRLLDIPAGATATVTTTNGHQFTYKLTGEHDTDPSDTSLFDYRGKPILTLQTCSGVFYQHRRLFTFTLVEAH